MQNTDMMYYASKVGQTLSDKYLTHGDYYPEQGWGCEGQIYPSLMGLMLLELYKVEKNEIYLQAVKSILTRNAQKQMSSGGWALSLGVVANGIKFEVNDYIKHITSTCEDLPPTATALRLLAEYQLLTGDTTFYSSLDKGINYLLTFWNKDEQVFNEMLVGEALKLRANPKNYHIYTFQCIDSLSKIKPELSDLIAPLYTSIKQQFIEMDADTYPLLYAMYASLIIEKEGASDFVLTTVKKRIDEDIALGSRFIIPDVPGAFGHRDGLRGICLDEGHLRNSVGAALVMKFYDAFVENDTYTKSKLYEDVTNWILDMFNGERFYEFIDLKTNEKLGLGTPGQYLPLMWILSKI